MLLPHEVSDGGPTLQLLRANLLILHAFHVDRPGRLVQIAKGLGKTQCGASHIVSMLEKVLGKAELFLAGRLAELELIGFHVASVGSKWLGRARNGDSKRLCLRVGNGSLIGRGVVIHAAAL